MVKNLYHCFSITILSFIDISSFAKLFLADWLVDKFDLIKGEVSPEQERVDIWLDEKKNPPKDYYASHEVIVYGFTPEIIVQNFPIKGMTVYLHLRRRKWQMCQTGKVFTELLDIAYRGTRLTKELVAFLKETN